MTAQRIERDKKLKAAQTAIEAGDFAGGLHRAELVLAENPADAKARYMAAVACRALRRLDDATDHLSALERAVPNYGRAWQERGHIALAKGNRDEAIAAFTKATQLNVSLLASWRKLVALFTEAGRSKGATDAREQIQRLSELPAVLLNTYNHLGEGRVAEAEANCRAYLNSSPRDVEALRLMAKIGIASGQLDEAEFSMKRAVAMQPDDTQLRVEYIDALRWQQKYKLAHEEAERLHTLDPNNVLFQSYLAIETMQIGDDARAIELFDKVLESLSDDVATLISRGHALRNVGRTDDAIESYRAALKASPANGDAWYALANLKTFVFSEADVAEMQSRIESGDLGVDDRISITFALGKAFEDRKNYLRSFKNYKQGNALKLARTGYDADAMTRELRRIEEICSADLFDKQANHGYQACDPIFIVGLPRAGSTLLEQILSSHSQIEGTLEWPNILALALRLRGNRSDEPMYPAILHELKPDELAGFGQKYIEQTRIHRHGAPFFIDKMPNNFRHIGLIHLILPNAKIIDARRAPLDCCFSAYRQLFALGQEYTYGLHEVGRYYADYVRLMKHWDEVLPGRVLRVQHEDVLDDVEKQTRRMLDFLGLPFEEACLSYFETDRSVRTPSSEQVRQPINRQGQGSWRPYKQWLGSLKNALGDLA